MLVSNDTFTSSGTFIDTVSLGSGDSIVITNITTLDSATCQVPDDCDSARSIFCDDTVQGVTSNASADSVYTCGSDSFTHSPGVWYKYRGKGELVIAKLTGNTGFDTKLSVYRSDNGCGDMTCVASNDDAQEGLFSVSKTSFIAENGVDYYLLVHGYSSSSGGFELSLNCKSWLVSGRVSLEGASNCRIDTNDTPISNQIISVDSGERFLVTDSTGYYSVYLDSGVHSLHLVEPPTYTKMGCPFDGGYWFTLSGSADTLNRNFFLENWSVASSSECPQVKVDVGTWSVRPCFSNPHYIKYGNRGTYPAPNTTIQLKVPTDMTMSGHTGVLDSVNSDSTVYTFRVGDLDIGETGSFIAYLDLPCDGDLVGLSRCVTVEVSYISPDSMCTFVTDTSTVWDNSRIRVTGECKQDTLACFLIQNTGAAMSDTNEYRIYSNNTLAQTAQFQLSAQDRMRVCWPANGRTIRLEADQDSVYPAKSHPQYTLEACGDSTDTISSGYVTAVPQDDLVDWRSIDCNIVSASYDPNNKRASPAGIDTPHYISKSDRLEYTINFQNTGTDTAFKVIIVDTLSQAFDIASFEPTASSHDANIQFLPPSGSWGPRTVKWTFRDIMLPDSSTDPEGSKGFVKFQVEPHRYNSEGARIENNADIYFDFNKPVKTNTTYHTVGLPNSTNIIKRKIRLETCTTYTNPSGTKTYNTGGTYRDTLVNEEGYPIYYTIHLTIDTVNASVTQTGDTLVGNDQSANYQWLDCEQNYSAITGETDRYFNPTTSGKYAVALTNNSCRDTSACYTIIMEGVAESHNEQIRLYPNPTEQNFSLIGTTVFDNVKVTVTNITGKVVAQQQFYNKKVINMEINGPKGMYFVSVINSHGEHLFKLMKY